MEQVVQKKRLLKFWDTVSTASTEECRKSIENCFTGSNSDSIKRGAKLFLNHKYMLDHRHIDWTSITNGAKFSQVDLFTIKNHIFDLQEKYVSSTERIGERTIQFHNFTYSTGVAEIINKWARAKTDGLIGTLINPEMVSNRPKELTLVTAISFKGKWKEKFEPSGEQDFKVIFGETTIVKKTEFMELKRKNLFGHYQDENNTQVINIPYQDDMKMTIIMPEGNLDEFESTLTTEKLNHYFQEVSPSEREVILKMPKFGFGVTHDLTKVLTSTSYDQSLTEERNQGLERDDSKRTARKIYISNFIHVASINVDEEGTVAVAPNEMVSVMPPIEITINKPFLFFIRSGGNVILAGRMVDPTIKCHYYESS